MRQRKTPAQLHAHHHKLIDARLASWKAMPNRSGLDKRLKREEWKKAYWLLKAHLSSPHDRIRVRSNTTLEEMIRLHDEAHARIDTSSC